MITADLITLTPARRWKDWGGINWTTGTVWNCHVCTYEHEFHLTVQPGFQTDGGSIPRFLQDRVSPLGKYLLAFLVHDVLYAGEFCDRATADWIFLELLEYLGASWIVRNACYLAVRAGGGFVWKKHTPESVADARRLIKFEAVSESLTLT